MGLIRLAPAPERDHSDERGDRTGPPALCRRVSVRHKVLDLIGDLALAGRRHGRACTWLRFALDMQCLRTLARLLKDRSRAGELAPLRAGLENAAMSEGKPEAEQGFSRSGAGRRINSETQLI